MLLKPASDSRFASSIFFPEEDKRRLLQALLGTCWLTKVQNDKVLPRLDSPEVGVKTAAVGAFSRRVFFLELRDAGRSSS